VQRDLCELRPRLRSSDAEFRSIQEAMSGRGGAIVRLLPLGGVFLGVAITFIDPAIAPGAAHSVGDPVFVWALVHSAVLVWLIVRLIVYDLNTTRLYTQMCRDSVEVDLLEVRALAAFARRGQRSALAWVLFSMIFALFWLGDWAASANLPLVVMVLSMATMAFGLPLVALHSNILAVKHAELDRLRQQIRDERAAAIVVAPSAEIDSPRLANAIGYYQLIDSAREWPVDAANLLKFAGYLMLGLGSWLGGAVVERLLDSALRS
jgi:hypothetical protein